MEYNNNIADHNSPLGARGLGILGLGEGRSTMSAALNSSKLKLVRF